jgi:hypothetical protein
MHPLFLREYMIVSKESERGEPQMGRLWQPLEGLTLRFGIQIFCRAILWIRAEKELLLPSILDTFYPGAPLAITGIWIFFTRFQRFSAKPRTPIRILS